MKLVSQAVGHILQMPPTRKNIRHCQHFCKAELRDPAKVAKHNTAWESPRYLQTTFPIVQEMLTWINYVYDQCDARVTPASRPTSQHLSTFEFPHPLTELGNWGRALRKAQQVGAEELLDLWIFFFLEKNSYLMVLVSFWHAKAGGCIQPWAHCMPVLLLLVCTSNEQSCTEEAMAFAGTLWLRGGNILELGGVRE